MADIGGQREAVPSWLQCSIHIMVNQLLLVKGVYLITLENQFLQRADRHSGKVSSDTNNSEG